jgi:hypothetical protein
MHIQRGGHPQFVEQRGVRPSSLKMTEVYPVKSCSLAKVLLAHL